MGSTGWVGVTIDTSGLSIESGADSWRITRNPSMGVTLAVVWGPVRRPYSWSGKNPWLEKADWTFRFPWFALPWFHMWWWRRRDADDFAVRGKLGKPHPARFYFGGKIFHADDRPGEDVWRDPSKDPVGYYITPSASFRRG